MNLQEMLTAIQEETGIQVNDEQEAVIAHEDGPLWVIAGPGSGKSEVLVLRTLKLVCVEEVHPKSIILTTFTEKQLGTYKTVWLFTKTISIRLMRIYEELICPKSEWERCIVCATAQCMNIVTPNIKIIACSTI